VIWWATGRLPRLFPTPIAATDATPVQDAAGQSGTRDLTNDAVGGPDPYPSQNIDQHAGADGFGALTFTGNNGSTGADGDILQGSLGGGSTGPLTTADGSTIYLFGFSDAAGVLYATTDSAGTGLPGGATGNIITADEVFTITLDHANDQYTFNMLQPIGNGSRTTFSDFADVPAGDYAWFSLPFGPIPPGPVSPGQSVLFTGNRRSSRRRRASRAPSSIRRSTASRSRSP
jgi:hypothetical protein